jgi:hypothetical protein
MNWIYLVTTDDRPRVQSRILQIFDKQMIAVSSFVSVRFGDQVYMRISGDTGACDGERLRALIQHLEDVRGIRAIPADDERPPYPRVFHAECARPQQRVLLEMLIAQGMNVHLVSPSHITFETIGSDAGVEEICETLKRHWPIERVPGEAEGPHSQGAF